MKIKIRQTEVTSPNDIDNMGIMIKEGKIEKKKKNWWRSRDIWAV